MNKFTLRRKARVELRYCRTRDLVYGTANSTMKVGEICVIYEHEDCTGRIKCLAKSAWDDTGYKRFDKPQQARAHLEQRFSEKFLRGAR